jgi:hypothetical protein
MRRPQSSVQRFIGLSTLEQSLELVEDKVIQACCVYAQSAAIREREQDEPDVKSSASASYIHIRIFRSASSGSSSFLAFGGGDAKIGRMSGLPKENVVEEWLKTESKETGLCFHPVEPVNLTNGNGSRDGIPLKTALGSSHNPAINATSEANVSCDHQTREEKTHVQAGSRLALSYGTARTLLSFR